MHGGRGQHEPSEEDVDSFFLPGGILDSLNNDSAESLLGVMGLRNRVSTSSHSRVLSMAAPSEWTQDTGDPLDFANIRALSSAGTNPHAPEFMPKPMQQPFMVDDVHVRESNPEPPIILPPNYLGHEPILSPHWEGMADEVMIHDSSYAYDYHTPHSHSPEYMAEMPHSYSRLHPLTIVNPVLYNHNMGLAETHDSLPLRTHTLAHTASSVPAQTQWFDRHVQALTFTQESGYDTGYDSALSSDYPATHMPESRGSFLPTRRSNLHELEEFGNNVFPNSMPVAPSASGGKDKDTRVRTARNIRRTSKERANYEEFTQPGSGASSQTNSPARGTSATKARRSSKGGLSTAEEKRTPKSDPGSVQQSVPVSNNIDVHNASTVRSKLKEHVSINHATRDRSASAVPSITSTDHDRAAGVPARAVTQQLPIAALPGLQASKVEVNDSVVQTKSSSNSEHVRAKSTSQVPNLKLDEAIPELAVKDGRSSSVERKVKCTAPQIQLHQPQQQQSSNPQSKLTETPKKTKPLPKDSVQTLSGATRGPQSGKPVPKKRSEERSNSSIAAPAITTTTTQFSAAAVCLADCHIQPQQPQAVIHSHGSSKAFTWMTTTLRSLMLGATSTILPYRISILVNFVEFCAFLCSHLVATVVCLLGVVLAAFLACFALCIQLHKFAIHEFFSDYHVAFCFGFPYGFKEIVSVVADWAPHWAPVCLWYSFLVQLFCTVDNGSGPMIQLHASVFRVLLPVLFIAEGVTSESYLMKLNGSELLLLSFALSAIKLECVFSPIFMLSWSIQVLAVCLLGPHPLMQYCQLMLSLTSLHAISLLACHHGQYSEDMPFEGGEDAPGPVPRAAVLEKPEKSVKT